MVATALAAGGDAVPPFGLAEHILDDMPLLVEMLVEGKFDLRGASLRDVMATS